MKQRRQLSTAFFKNSSEPKLKWVRLRFPPGTFKDRKKKCTARNIDFFQICFLMQHYRFLYFLLLPSCFLILNQWLCKMGLTAEICLEWIDLLLQFWSIYGGFPPKHRCDPHTRKLIFLYGKLWNIIILFRETPVTNQPWLQTSCNALACNSVHFYHYFLSKKKENSPRFSRKQREPLEKWQRKPPVCHRKNHPI